VKYSYPCVCQRSLQIGSSIGLKMTNQLLVVEEISVYKPTGGSRWR